MGAAIKRHHAAPVLTKEEAAAGIASNRLHRIEQAAKRWWTAQRPEGWTLDQHLDEPTVNCTSKTSRDLATAVADWCKLGG